MSRFFILSLLASLSLIAKKETNFVFFLVDDMGMMDLGTYGSNFHENPNIDKLAKTGMKFNSLHLIQYLFMQILEQGDLLPKLDSYQV